MRRIIADYLQTTSENGQITCNLQVKLAGRLGFEPRPSAPKALDLPLVDRPKLQAVTITDHGAPVFLSANRPGFVRSNRLRFQSFDRRPSVLRRSIQTEQRRTGA